MRKILLLLLPVLLLSACEEKRAKEQPFLLQGAWVLQQLQYSSGYSAEKSAQGDETMCIIYKGDSVVYECWLSMTPTGMVIVPKTKADVTLIDRGGGQLLYLENDKPRPLYFCHEGDSLSASPLLVVQRNGVLYKYEQADNIYREWGEEICDIVSREKENISNGILNRYMLSSKERQQERKLQWFSFLLAFGVLVVMIIANLAVAGHRAKRQLQLQLQQILEVQENRSQGVKEAVKTMENDFFASDAYANLQKRISTGQRLKEPDWADIEEQLKKVYPGFTSQLRSLYPMSELEYQVCQLIKLRIAPSDIACVLSRDASTISTVRSRLYKKVFGRKGSTRQWDDFILSM